MKYLVQFLQSAFLLIILAITLICIEFSVAPVFSKCTGNVLDLREISMLGFLVAYTGAFFFLVPATLNKFFFKETLKNIYLTIPENKKQSVLLIVLALLLLVPLLIYIEQQESVRAAYALGQPKGLAKFIFIQLFILPPYYFAEEFFFRGFIFINLWRKIKWHSFWVTEFLFVWAHLSKPLPEIALSLPAGIILNYVVLKTRSLYPAMLIHYTLGVVLNILVKFYI